MSRPRPARVAWGSVLNLMGAGNANALQRVAVEESRLGIPLIYGLDVIHGYWTTFPIPLAQAAAFDPSVTETDGAVSAREARSDGIHWVFSPMMDVYYNRENTGRPYDPARPENPFVSAYLDLADGPQFPFGHGLSYTTFTVDEPALSQDRIDAAALRDGATVEVTVPVRNTGDRPGDEVVQLYVHDRAASIVQPVRKLRGFHRVHLAAGEETTVRFTLAADDLGFWTGDPAGRFVVEPGEIDIHTGTTSATTASRTLTIT